MYVPVGLTHRHVFYSDRMSSPQFAEAPKPNDRYCTVRLEGVVSLSTSRFTCFSLLLSRPFKNAGQLPAVPFERTEGQRLYFAARVQE
ncbi:hypothetical protein OUZ56_001912 [Daphnia magna]|uniref:Uncharacterized protein n=1 Tax=Daphnia magna TaxID=35525 RepID=A0ABR0A440_9CRUS|nr:hypothetical protein OUZ56_001912 [Daphnia magna]